MNSKNNLTTVACHVQSDGIEDQIIGYHETQELEVGEADLHKCFIACKKNPGHRQFIPVDTFSLDHLPKDLQDNILYEYIKAVADLTVRVSVKLSSPGRPMFWPKTNQPYPFYNMSDSTNVRTGSGSVWKIYKFQDGVLQDGARQEKGIGKREYTHCWCRKCQDSDSPSQVWWEFYVYTATHVVFDDIEANNTTLRLFYDREDSPVVSVDNVMVEDVSVEDDLCRLNCVSCDKYLGDKLTKISQVYFDVWEKVTNKYFDSRDKYKITFIVSHPHGCSKQVSVGQWKEKHKVGDRIKFSYTTCTCPGSSGAFVQCVGYSDKLWSDLVHSGSLRQDLNYSGAGFVF
uniref:Uncharacterized protein n=1 Tax=Biomphalaria glabrata TaxID=6526 RepID=A0A2C9M072_BIOGL